MAAGEPDFSELTQKDKKSIENQTNAVPQQNSIH